MSHQSLEDGSTIAVIGGGPAGSFFATLVQRLSRDRGLALNVKIFDGKDFSLSGPRGCNLCAGVIAESLNDKLQDEGIFLPDKRVIHRIAGYSLHIDDQTLALSGRRAGAQPIATVFRGNGPRFSMYPEIISFDDFLLTFARDMGAEVIGQPVWNIALPGDQRMRPRLYYGAPELRQEMTVDLIVGAFGVNSNLAHKFKNLGFGYMPPSTLKTYQTEIKLDPAVIEKKLGDTIHVFMPQASKLRFATLIPKGDFVTVSLIGKEDADSDLFQEFLRLKEVKSLGIPQRPHCSCFPRIIDSSARHPWSDRLVIIGDASFCRHYKNGIESAFITAQMAARACVEHGIDARSLRRHYALPTRKLIHYDNRYGRMLFRLHAIIARIPVVRNAHIEILVTNRYKAASRKIHFILWHMFTGTIPYKRIFFAIFDLRLQLALMSTTILLLLRQIKSVLNKRKKRAVKVAESGSPK